MTADSDQLIQFTRQAHTLLREGRALLEAFAAGGTPPEVKRPVLLKISLEKCMDMLEQHLVPLLPEEPAPHAGTAEKSAAPESLNPAATAATADDDSLLEGDPFALSLDLPTFEPDDDFHFLGTTEPFEPAESGTESAAHSGAHAAAAAPTAGRSGSTPAAHHRVDDFRGSGAHSRGTPTDKHRIDDFRKSGAVSAPAAPAPKTHRVDDFRGSGTHRRTGAAAGPSGTHRVDDFRHARPKPATASGSHQARQVDDFRGSGSHARPAAPQPSPQPAPSVETPAAAQTTEAGTPTRADLGKPMLETGLGSRRRIPRYKARMPLMYHQSGHTDATRAYSKDVGAMGLFIMANRPEKRGQHLEIEIELPGKIKATLQVVVQWTKWVPPNLRGVDQPGFGVKVTNATENWYQYFMN